MKLRGGGGAGGHPISTPPYSVAVPLPTARGRPGDCVHQYPSLTPPPSYFNSAPMLRSAATCPSSTAARTTPCVRWPPPLTLPPPPPLPPHVPLSGDVPIEYCGEDQAVCAVGIATPRAGVFLEAIQHLIVLCTTSEVWKSIGKVWETCVGCSWKMRAGVVLEA